MLESHGLSVGYEALGPSPRVRGAAARLKMQSHEAVAARYGLTKTAL